ncbi:hypothetical protein CHUAL_003237 [Chamberlinius hualienensis]
MATLESSINNFFRSLGNRFDSGTKEHLKNVYSCLSMTALAAAVGAYVHIIGLLEASFLTILLDLGLLLAVMFTTDNGKNQGQRLLYLLGFALCSGLNSGPLLNMAIYVDPSVIPTALMGTAVIFICFTLSALYSSNRYWLYLGGILSSGLSILILLSFMTLFFRSKLLFDVQLYLGLFVMCGFVLYDTQLIVEKRLRGDKDYIKHSLELFIDLIKIFRHLTVILMQKKREEERGKRRS